MMLPHEDSVTDEYGRLIPGAKIYVYKADGTLAALTSDSASSLEQPVSTDEFGTFKYYVDQGIYREDIWYGGKLRYRQAGVAVGDAVDTLNDAVAEAQGFAASAANTLLALEAAAAGAQLGVFALPVFTPEMYANLKPSGVCGDGTDDGLAFAAMSAALNAVGRGAIGLYPGRTYWIGSQTLNGAAPPQGGGGVYTFAPDTPNPIDINGCTGPVVINGNGARIKCLPGKKYGAFNEDGSARADALPFTGALGIAGFNIATPYAAMVYIRDCSGPVQVSGLELDGNIANALIGGPWSDDFGIQIPMSGTMFENNTGSLDVDVWSHHHGLDGGFGNGPGLLNTKESARIGGCFEHNGRNNFSLVGGNGWHFEDGLKLNGAGKDIGAMAYSLPGAGIDLEAEGGKYVVNTTFGAIVSVDNSGAALLMVGANTFNVTSRDARWIGTTNASLYGDAKGLKVYGGVVAGALVNLYGSDDLDRTAQFHGALITNDPAVSPTGVVYLAAGVTYTSGTADKFFLNTCKIQQVLDGAVVRYFGDLDSCFLHNCTIEDLGVGGNFIVSGRYSGSKTSFTGPGVGVPSNSAGGPFSNGGEAEDSYLLNGVRKNATIDKATGKLIYYGSAVYDPPSLAAAAKTAIQNMAVAGVALGDKVDEVSFSVNLAGARIQAWVSAADTVSYYFVNENGANPLDLAPGTIRVKVTQA
jgi:hypothetical protein